MSVASLVLCVVLVAVVVQSTLLLLLFRQVGALLLSRVEAMQVDGPALGSTLTEEMRKAVGFELRGEAEESNGARTLLLMTRRGCTACEKALRSLPKWLRERDPAPALWVSGDGMLDCDPATRVRLRSSGVVERTSLEALAVLGIGVTPFALLLNSAGRVLAKGVLSSEEHLEHLESQAEELQLV